MKFLQFYRDGRPTLGVITEKGVVDMSAHPELPQTMLALCQSGDTAALAALDGPYLEEESLTLAPVVTGMEKILCIGLNYRAHAAECGIPLPESPTVFCKLPNALAAHGQAIALPAAEEIDYEAELVLVMGEGGRVFACTCGNDLSVREWQRASGQWLCGKTYDGFGPIGPYAVDAESLPTGGIGISCPVNGELRQKSNTALLITSIGQILEELTGGMTLLPGTILRGHTAIGSGCEIGPNAMVRDCIVGKDTTINASQVNESTIGSHTTVGPFTYVRPNCRIGDHCRVGDFVEVKNSVIGDGTKISHLTYVGDSDVGQRVNFGCGTVTTNYDGHKKHRCTIGDDVFLGCNTNLIAPVTVEDRAYTAAGSTVTDDVPEGALAIARQRQTNIRGWADRLRKTWKK